MAKTFTLRIVTSDRMLVDEPVRSVRFRGVDGGYGILANHAPLLTAMEAGPLHYEGEGGRQDDVVLGDGFAEMRNNVLTIVCESGERLLDIDVARAREAERRARERLADRGSMSSEQVLLAEASLRRALARLSARGGREGRADV